MDNYKKNIIESYNKYATHRDKKEIDPWKMMEVNKFEKVLEDEGLRTLLDLGAGPGLYGSYFQLKAYKVTCLDISKEMVKLCKDKNLQAEVMDFYHMAYKDDAWDAIWSMNSLLHVPKANMRQVLGEIKRVTRADGYIYIGRYGGKSSEGVWEDDSYQPPRFFSFYSDHEWKMLLEKYFTIIDFQTVETGDPGLHFQSAIVKNRLGPDFDDEPMDWDDIDYLGDTPFPHFG